MARTYTIKGYKPALNIRETEVAIKRIKDHFETGLADKLNLTRVSAPLFVKQNTGVNDNLNGVERKVAFTAMETGEDTLEIVQSLAKWKRLALHRYSFCFWRRTLYRYERHQKRRRNG